MCELLLEVIERCRKYLLLDSGGVRTVNAWMDYALKTTMSKYHGKKSEQGSASQQHSTETLVFSTHYQLSTFSKHYQNNNAAYLSLLIFAYLPSWSSHFGRKIDAGGGENVQGACKVKENMKLFL